MEEEEEEEQPSMEAEAEEEKQGRKMLKPDKQDENGLFERLKAAQGRFSHVEF